MRSIRNNHCNKKKSLISEPQLLFNINSLGIKHIRCKEIGMKRLKRENLSDKLADIYGKKIIHNELKSGDIIMETQISAEWGVSRSPVRDALHILEKQKLVEKDKSGSYKVPELTIDHVDNLFDAINMIFTYSFPTVVEKMTNDHLNYLASLNEEIVKSAENCDSDAYIKNFTAFAHTFLKIADNPIIENIAFELAPTAQRIQYAAIEMPSSLLKEGCIHVPKMLEYTQKKDCHNYAATLKEFLNVSRNSFITCIEVEKNAVKNSK